MGSAFPVCKRMQYVAHFVHSWINNLALNSLFLAHLILFLCRSCIRLPLSSVQRLPRDVPLMGGLQRRVHEAAVALQ
eukprot:6118424-Amphidinium_carterae.1